MRFEEHCKESEALFGAPFDYVHRWLDAFAFTPEYGLRHRRVRHHEAGIQEAIRIFGKAAGPVARQHIISDLKLDGWTESDPFPKDEAHYVKMGLF
jgi:hypothetical protein